MATADMKLQLEAQGVDVKTGAAWEATVTLADGTTRTVGYDLLTDSTPIATPTKKAVAKKATVPAKATARKATAIKAKAAATA